MSELIGASSVVVSFPWFEQQRLAWQEAAQQSPWKINVSRDVHRQFYDWWDIVHPYDLAVEWGFKPGTKIR